MRNGSGRANGGAAVARPTGVLTNVTSTCVFRRTGERRESSRTFYELLQYTERCSDNRFLLFPSDDFFSNRIFLTFSHPLPMDFAKTLTDRDNKLKPSNHLSSYTIFRFPAT